MKKGPVTAAEAVAALEADAVFVANRARVQKERDALAAEWTRAERPLVQALGAAGFSVSTAWDFVNRPNDYADALPILLEHLSRPYPDRVREGIARAMAMPEARFAWDALVRLYLLEGPTTDAKNGLAVALAAAADASCIEQLIGLVRDRRHGPTRGFFLSVLAHSRRPSDRAVLTELGDDPELAGEINALLARRRR